MTCIYFSTHFPFSYDFPRKTWL